MTGLRSHDGGSGWRKGASHRDGEREAEQQEQELITGIDLVEQMILVAAGEKLKFKQSDIKINGWAIESRIYAEDPYRSFLPSTGRLVRYQPPAENTHKGLTVRNDTGVYEGGEISIYYDPMIAKLVTHGPDRESATKHMSRALDSFCIEGIGHNIPFLSAVMDHPRWLSGDISTGFIEEEYADGFQGVEPDEEAICLLSAVAASIDHLNNSRRRTISGQMGGKEVSFTQQRVVVIGDNNTYVSVIQKPDILLINFRKGSCAGETVEVISDWVPGNPLWTGTVNSNPVAVQVKPVLNGYRLLYRGIDVEAHTYTEREAELQALMPIKVPVDTSGQLLCPMPGLVVSIAVEIGEAVKAGQSLCVIEAMKMENVLKAERDCVVAAILAEPGDKLAVDQVIIEFEKDTS